MSLPLANLPSLRMRDAIKLLSPAYLRDGDAEKFLYTIGLACDALIDKSEQATEAHLPGVGTDTATPFLGEDRVLVQGPSETNDQYTDRIRNALDAWALVGSRRAVLGQIQAFLSNTQPGVVATTPQCLIVGGNASISTWDTLYWNQTQGATPMHVLRSPANWEWDGEMATKPHRAWLVLFFTSVATGHTGAAASVAANAGGVVTLTGPTNATASRGQWITVSGAASAGNNGKFPVVAAAAGGVTILNAHAVAPDANNGSLAWSMSAYPFIGPGLGWDDPGAKWGDTDRSWGLSCRSQLVASLRALVKTWKGAGTYYPWLVFAFDGGGGSPGDWFSPYSAIGAGNPDGSWGSPGKLVNGVWVPSRVTSGGRDEFCDGTGIYDNCAVHNVT